MYKQLENRVEALAKERLDRPTHAGASENTTPNAGAWIPKHIIMGGWAERTDRDVIERDALQFLHPLSPELQWRGLALWAPRKYGSIAMMKTTGNCDEMAFKITVAHRGEEQRQLHQQGLLGRRGAQSGGGRARKNE